MNIQGKIHEIYPTKQIKDNFQKRDFVVEYSENSQYPQHLKFELMQDNCGILDGFKKGDDVDVSFNLRGRAWTNKQGETTYFNSLVAWKLDPISGSMPPQSGKSENSNQEFSPDDLPF